MDPVKTITDNRGLDFLRQGGAINDFPSSTVR